METLIGSMPEPEGTPEPTYKEQVATYRQNHKAALKNIATALNAPANNASVTFHNAIN